MCLWSPYDGTVRKYRLNCADLTWDWKPVSVEGFASRAARPCDYTLNQRLYENRCRAFETGDRCHPQKQQWVCTPVFHSFLCGVHLVSLSKRTSHQHTLLVSDTFFSVPLAVDPLKNWLKEVQLWLINHVYTFFNFRTSAYLMHSFWQQQYPIARAGTCSFVAQTTNPLVFQVWNSNTKAKYVLSIITHWAVEAFSNVSMLLIRNPCEICINVLINQLMNHFQSSQNPQTVMSHSVLRKKSMKYVFHVLCGLIHECWFEL